MVTPAADPVLTRYLAPNEDLAALSAETGQPIPALLDWLHTPQIARTVARFRAHQAHQLTAFALHALAAIISATPDLIEKRRAATTILKTLNGPATPRPCTRLSDPGPFDDADHLQANAEGLNDDDLTDPAEGNFDDSGEADNLETDGFEDDTLDAKKLEPQNLAHAEDRNQAPTPPAAEVELQLPTSPAPVPPLSTQYSALSTSAGTQHSALSTPSAPQHSVLNSSRYTPPPTGPPQRHPPDSHKLPVHARP